MRAYMYTYIYMYIALFRYYSFCCVDRSHRVWPQLTMLRLLCSSTVRPCYGEAPLCHSKPWSPLRIL
uniref:Uncharacterized protein n=1 Tax=Anopheles albimanus TaxID=7167 RepID=A0A182FY59_ANOAL